MYMVSTPYNFQLNANRFSDHYISYASKLKTPYEYWTADNEKKFSCKRFSHELLFLICMLMIQIRNSNLQKKTCPSWDMWKFLEYSSSQFPKLSFWTKTLPLHFQSIPFIIWKQQVQLVHCEIMILWNNIF